MAGRIVVIVSGPFTVVVVARGTVTTEFGVGIVVGLICGCVMVGAVVTRGDVEDGDVDEGEIEVPGVLFDLMFDG